MIDISSVTEIKVRFIELVVRFEGSPLLYNGERQESLVSSAEQEHVHLIDEGMKCNN